MNKFQHLLSSPFQCVNKLLTLRLLKRDLAVSMMLNQDYYELLGVARNATTAEIRAKYINLCKEHHPDKNQSKPQSRFVQINEAYSTLSNAKKRKEYDYNISNPSQFRNSSNYYQPPRSRYQPYRETGRRHSDEYYKRRGEYWRHRYKGYDEEYIKAEQMHRQWEARKAYWDSNMAQDFVKSNIHNNHNYNNWNRHYANREYWRSMSSSEIEIAKRNKKILNYIIYFLLTIYIFLPIVGRSLPNLPSNPIKDNFYKNDETHLHSSNVKANIEYVKQKLAEEKIDKTELMLNANKNSESGAQTELEAV